MSRGPRHGVPVGAAVHAAAGRRGPVRSPLVASAYAATVRAQAAILPVINAQVDEMEEQVDAHFSKHPDAKVYLSQPGRDRAAGTLCVDRLAPRQRVLPAAPGTR